MQVWKVPHIVKGLLTWVPGVNAWRMVRGSTGGTNSSCYCYAVWLRHLVMLHRYGFRIKGARIGELGPGDSIGTGLAALLSGASRYVGLDAVPYSAKTDHDLILKELVEMYLRKEPIPNACAFPQLRPMLTSYEFPNEILDLIMNFDEKVKLIQRELRKAIMKGGFVNYVAPWNSASNLELTDLDLVFSQAVLQYVDELEQIYSAMFTWLKPGGYASHRIGFSETHLSPYWNGHWAYSDFHWQMVRGRHEGFLNRAPLSTHLNFAKKAGFQIVFVEGDFDDEGLNAKDLSPRYQSLSEEDRRTRGVMLILRKPE